MNKPITVAHCDFMEALAKVCNESELPAFVKIDVLDKALVQLRKFADDEYRKDNEQYQKALQNEKMENDQKRAEAQNRAKIQNTEAHQINKTMKPFTGEVNMGG